MLLSIIVPVYNKDIYIEDTLKSILDQSYTDFECLVIDDGSTDNSGIICDHYSELDNRIIIKHKRNGGVSSSRNLGLDLARGDYITFVDADDILDSRYLETLVLTAENEKVDFVIQSMNRFVITKEETDIIQYPIDSGKYSMDKLLPNFAEYQKKSGLFGWCGGKLIARKLIGETRFNQDYSLAEDFDFFLHIYSKTESVFIDNKALYYYRVNAQNSSVRINDYDIEYLNQVYINLNYKAFLKKKNSFSGMNKQIVEQLIINHLYNTVFYAKLNEFETLFSEASKIYNEEISLKKNGPIIKRLILKCLRTGNCGFAKNIIIIYRRMRAILKGSS